MKTGNRIKLTQLHLFKAMSSNGALSTKQFNVLGYDKAFKGWKTKLIGKYFKEDAVMEFIGLKNAHLKGGRGVHKKVDLEERRRVIPSSNRGEKARKRAEYLHPDWTAIRNAVKARDGEKCVCCDSDKKDGAKLVVHHLLYRNNAELWEVPMYYLVTLCEKCHKYEHAMDVRPQRKTHDIEDIIGYE